MAASMERYGTLRSNTGNLNTPVNVRYQPSGEVKLSLPAGTRVKILIEPAAPDQSGFKWFQIQYGPGINDSGWVRGDVIVVDPPIPPLPTPTPTTPPIDANTYLFFETNTRLVRVFINRDQLCMNLYQKGSNTTELNAVPASRIPVLDLSNTQWYSYLAQWGTTTFVARCIPRAETELVLATAVDGSIIGRESGFAAKGIVYLGR
jgi:hypothetical protein